jgi:tetratricopeptide (TPR) repeat protein
MKTLSNQTVRHFLAFVFTLLPLFPLSAQDQSPQDLEAAGEALRQQGEPEKALATLEKAYTEWTNLGGWHNPGLIDCYFLMGKAHLDLGQFEEAIYKHKKSNELIDKQAEKNRDRIADNYRYVGVNYPRLGNYSRAIVYLNKALELKRELHGEHHSQLAPLYRDRGDFFAARENWNEALLNYQYAILNAFADFHDTDTDALPEPGRHQLVVPETELSGYLLAKIALLRRRYEALGMQNDLKTALETAQIATQFDHAPALYEQALELCHLLFDQTKNILYLDLAFDLLEKSLQGSDPHVSLQEVQVVLNRSGSGLASFFSGEKALFGFVINPKQIALHRVPYDLSDGDRVREWTTALQDLPPRVAVIPTGALDLLPAILKDRELSYATSATHWLEANGTKGAQTPKNTATKPIPRIWWWAGAILGLIALRLAYKRYRRRQLLRKIGR